MDKFPDEPFRSHLMPVAVAVTSLGVLADRAAWQVAETLYLGQEDLPRHLKLTGMMHAVLFREAVSDLADALPELELRRQPRWLPSDWPRYSMRGHELYVHRRSRTSFPTAARYQGAGDDFEVDDSRWNSARDVILGFPYLAQTPSPDSPVIRLIGISNDSGRMTHARVLSPNGATSTHWDFRVTEDQVRAQIAAWEALPVEDTPWLDAIRRAIAVNAPPAPKVEASDEASTLADRAEAERGPFYDASQIEPPEREEREEGDAV